jgi:hypothetical protein
MTSLKAPIMALIIATLVVSGVAWRLHFGVAVGHGFPKESHSEIASPPLQVPDSPSANDALPGPIFTPRATTLGHGSFDTKESAATDNIKRPGVAGGPLVIPDSISAACKDSGIKGAHLCDRLYVDIAQMEKEPRDSGWSGVMEEKLQAYVEQQFQDASIRNIECRTSWCELEVESTNPNIVAVFPYPNPLNNQLSRDTWMESKVGVGLQIFVVVYKRK